MNINVRGYKMGIVHRNPTEESFIVWMSNYPESFHFLDMKRFYTFAKNVNSYHAKRWFDKKYFRKQIKLHNPNFSENNIDYFYEHLLMCRDYHKSVKTATVDLYDGKWIERRVINHKITDKPIENIYQYRSKKSAK